MTMTHEQRTQEEKRRRWNGQALFQAAETFRKAVRESEYFHPGEWSDVLLGDVANGLAAASIVAARLGFHPAPTAPDSAPAP